MQQKLKDFNAAVLACLKLASDKYNVDLSAANVIITTDVTGRAAGWARGLKDGKYKLRFNREAIDLYHEDMVENTIPHEVAHLVCYARPELGKRHDFGWKAVCRGLGGDDSRTHDMSLTAAKIVPSRRQKYTTDSGRICNVGPKHHKMLQAGRTDIFMRNPKEFLRADQWEHYGKVPKAPQNVLVAAGINIVHSNIPAAPVGASKRERAQAIYMKNKHLSRGEVIKLFVAHAEMTVAGAGTYYQNFKKSGI